MIRRTPLKRSTKSIKRSAVKKSRSKPRPGRLKGADMDELRNDAYMRDEGRCVVCKKLVMFYAPPEHDDSMHLAHRRGKRMWGDHINQVDTNCGSCHRKFHNFGPSMTKPVPKKERPS